MPNDRAQTSPIFTNRGDNRASVAYGAVEEQTCSPQQDGDEVEEHRGENAKAKYKTFTEIWVVCLALWAAIFCAAMSATIVANIQLEIGSDFNAGSLASWLGTAFLLGVTAITPLCGRMVEMLGSRNCFLIALAMFLTGTIGCALASSMIWVLVARAIAGMGSGGLNTFAAIILARLVSPVDRGLYQGGSSVLQAAGSAVGAVLGGAVAESWGWRSAFWIQIPPILLTMRGSIKAQVDDAKPEGCASDKLKGLDWAGSATLLSAVFAMTLGFTFHNKGFDWSHPLVGGILVISVFSASAFVWVEKRATEPLLPLRLLRHRQPALLLLANIPLTAMWYSRVYFQPVYLQISRGVDVYHSGSLMMPFTVVAACISVYAGWHMRALVVVTTWGIDTNSTRIATELAVAGIGAIPYTTLTSLPEVLRLQARLAYMDATRNIFAFIAALGVILSAICVGIRALPLK
ncbi:hypothetical protein I317_07781 [Kwoniella heveanensis CBS 569]|nr:hypothetical protein I317_07781 [Kwoniella heveanensis CBS 569]